MIGDEPGDTVARVALADQKRALVLAVEERVRATGTGRNEPGSLRERNHVSPSRSNRSNTSGASACEVTMYTDCRPATDEVVMRSGGPFGIDW